MDEKCLKIGNKRYVESYVHVDTIIMFLIV